MEKDLDQDALAEQWAAALADQDDSGSSGGAEDGGLADEWAKALADDEADSLKREKEQNFLSTRAKDAEFKDLTEEAKAPRVDGTKRELDFILDIPLDVSAELGAHPAAHQRAAAVGPGVGHRTEQAGRRAARNLHQRQAGGPAAKPWSSTKSSACGSRTSSAPWNGSSSLARLRPRRVCGRRPAPSPWRPPGAGRGRGAVHGPGRGQLHRRPPPLPGLRLGQLLSGRGRFVPDPGPAHGRRVGPQAVRPQDRPGRVRPGRSQARRPTPSRPQEKRRSGPLFE